MIPQLSTPTLDGNSVTEKREQLVAYFKNTWSTYDSLFSLINHDDAYFLRPEPLRHPLIFYFGHTATFYINKLVLGKYIEKRVNGRLEAICAVGVDEMSWDDLNSEHYDWPSVDEVRDYRKKVYQLVLDLINTMELTLPISQNSLAWVILMGCEHERIHLETSSVIMRMLSLKWLRGAEAWQPCTLSDDAQENCLIAIEQQTIALGKKPDDKTFGWDNEYGTLAVKVDKFKASKYLVSNQEFMAFVNAEGYQNQQFWCDEGKAWLQYTQAKMPRFWRFDNGDYYQRNLLDEIPLPMNWPVEVNFLEAKAFCQWYQNKSEGYIRLPTEAEWNCLRESFTEVKAKTGNLSNLELAHYASSCPVNQFQHGEFFDVVGNVWQWTETPIDGFPGFKVHPLYDDFSTPTFDGKHNLIKGGSWISTGNEALASSRYAFRRHFFQHAGFRYIESDKAEVSQESVNEFEIDENICQQLDCYFGDNRLAFDDYSGQITRFIKNLLENNEINTKRLLNLGCSVGRIAFDLSNTFESIDAVDFSARTIQHAVKLQSGSCVRYTSIFEGEICDYKEIKLEQVIPHVNKGGIQFSQGDGCNLKAVFQSYDVVFIQHALEKSYDPAALLRNVISRLNPIGIVIILSDFNYQIEHTPMSKRLSGLKVNGENVFANEALTSHLGDKFDYIGHEELYRVVAKSARNFNVDKCQISAWQLKQIL